MLLWHDIITLFVKVHSRFTTVTTITWHYDNEMLLRIGSETKYELAPRPNSNWFWDQIQFGSWDQIWVGPGNKSELAHRLNPSWLRDKIDQNRPNRFESFKNESYQQQNSIQHVCTGIQSRSLKDLMVNTIINWTKKGGKKKKTGRK